MSVTRGRARSLPISSASSGRARMARVSGMTWPVKARALPRSPRHSNRDRSPGGLNASRTLAIAQQRASSVRS